MKVLFLSAWYPSEKDRMMGLFVQKHAQAVAAQGADVRVNTWWPEADVVQLNVLTLKMGLVAYVLKRVLGIPYILVEHWSTYLPENGTYMQQPRWKRVVLKEIAREANGIYPVSRKLEDSMKACGIENRKWGRMENVVDDFFFTPHSSLLPPHSPIINLLHVSCFDERAKNVCSLLRAIKAVSEQRQDFRLTLVGTGKDWQMCCDYARKLAIPESMLRWTGELTPEQVFEEMLKADAFVLSSRYENAPVVLSECIAMGLPIVSTRAGGIPEMVTKDMGILVPTEDDTALAEAVNTMLDHYRDYDKEKIRKQGEKYSFEAVGRKLMKIYEEVIR